jgi:hypothetical protein
MPTPATTLIDSIARRVRDDANTAHSRAFVRDLLDRTQVIVNAKQEAITATRVVTNTANKALYTLESDLQGLIDVQTIRLGGVRLDEITPWRNLFKLSASWLADRAPQPRGWARIGRSLVVVYPAPQVDIELEFQGSAITIPLTADSVPLQLEREDEDMVRDLVTALLLFRQRDLDMLQPLMQRLDAKHRGQVSELNRKGSQPT